jgi:hypothetical protein
MKKSLAIMFIATIGILLLKYHSPLEPRLIETKISGALHPAGPHVVDIIGSTVTPKPTNIEKVEKQIAATRELVRTLESDLKVAGFPQVLNQDETSEATREEIYRKVTRLTDLSIELVQLRRKKVKLESEAGL